MSEQAKANGRATLVVTAVPNPSEMDAAQEYLKGVLPILMGLGGQLVKRLKVGDVIYGRPSGMVLVMDFESEAAISNMFESQEYAALVPARDRGFTEMNILVTGEM